MKPEQLKPGQQFCVADACHRDETMDAWTVVTVKRREVNLPEFVNLDGSKGKTIVTRVDVEAVRASDGVHVPLSIGPWVELTLLKPSESIEPSVV